MLLDLNVCSVSRLTTHHMQTIWLYYLHESQYSHKHHCNVCLTQCQQYPGKTVKCANCKRICRSAYSYQQYKLIETKHNLIPRDTMKYCDACDKTYKCGKNRREHKLDEDLPHQCFIQPVEKQEHNENYILCDFETRYHNDKHEAYFVCAMDMDGNKFCYNTVSAFVKHYRQPKFRGYTFIAHNASGFDAYFECLTETVDYSYCDNE